MNVETGAELYASVFLPIIENWKRMSKARLKKKDWPAIYQKEKRIHAVFVGGCWAETMLMPKLNWEAVYFQSGTPKATRAHTHTLTVRWLPKIRRSVVCFRIAKELDNQETILHELAHVLSPVPGHGKEFDITLWKLWCQHVSVETPTSTNEEMNQTDAIKGYVAVWKALDFLYDDNDKLLWMECPHKLLEHKSPKQIIREGKTEEVLRVINQLKTGAYV